MSTNSIKDVAVAIPTCNGGRLWRQMPAALSAQGIDPQQVLVIDTASTDGTLEVALKAGYSVHSITAIEFDHGATRQMAIDLLPWAKIVVFLTQDSIPADNKCISELIRPFDCTNIGAVFGRQLPRPGAGPFEAYSRLFNYGSRSVVRSMGIQQELAFKAVFASNSCAAYRVEALKSVNGFPRDIIVSEDTIVFAKMLKAGWNTAYVAEARVYHSHQYTRAQEFRRYFDIGVLHSRESWVLEEFGKADGEGWRYVKGEISHLFHEDWRLIPRSLMRSLIKYLAYRSGRAEEWIPTSLKRSISGHPNYW